MSQPNGTDFGTALVQYMPHVDTTGFSDFMMHEPLSGTGNQRVSVTIGLGPATSWIRNLDSVPVLPRMTARSTPVVVVIGTLCRHRRGLRSDS